MIAGDILCDVAEKGLGCEYLQASRLGRVARCGCAAGDQEGNDT
jgi:hypothetical protein